MPHIVSLRTFARELSNTKKKKKRRTSQQIIVRSREDVLGGGVKQGTRAGFAVRIASQHDVLVVLVVVVFRRTILQHASVVQAHLSAEMRRHKPVLVRLAQADASNLVVRQLPSPRSGALRRAQVNVVHAAEVVGQPHLLARW